jgi:thiol-disulfide isomerase/thioredoxin
MPRGLRLPATLAALLLAVPAGAGDPSQSRLTPIDAAQFRAVLAEQRGQVVLLNFWATWCRPCLKEIPELTALAGKYRAQGLRLVAVSLDEPGDLHTVVKPFLQKWFPDLQTYARLTPDMDGIVSVVDPAWNEVLPTSYVIDRKGIVRTLLQGGKSAAEFEAAVVPLLKER